jgi:methionine-rich copper-binding protein CopC
MNRHLAGDRLRAVVSFVIVISALAFPVGVLAHAELETVSPADGAVVTEAPAEIVMTFSEDLDPDKSSIVVVDASGTTIASGGIVDPADPTRMVLALSGLGAGAYELRWTSASTEDGDIDRGTTSFTYAPPPSPSPTVAATTTPSAPPSASPSIVPSPASTASPSPSADGTPAASSTDILLPIVAALAVVVLLGAWLLHNRARGARP